MAPVFKQPTNEAQLHWAQDTPIAEHYGDAYFMRHQGPAETNYVFLQGNQLEERFQQLPSNGFFVVGETGFGTGLNFLATAAAFLRHAPAKARLHFVSTEKHPLRLEDLRKAQAFWPELAELSAELQAHYPEPTPGFHRRWLANHRIALTLIYADVEEGLAQFGGKVDAWFLDGFAPAKNPDMWQASLFNLLAQHSAKGATLATFTAAGFVRRGLIAAGFAMQKRKGFGTKRDMLVGALSGKWQPQHYAVGDVAIAGAGLAGATCARLLAELGYRVHLYDAKGVAAGASGNLAGVLYTTPSPAGTAQNLFYQHSYLHSLYRLRTLGFPLNAEQGALNGVVYELANPRQRDKILAALNSPYWPQSLLQQSNHTQVHLPQSGFISPKAWCEHLIAHSNITLHLKNICPTTFKTTTWALPHGKVNQLVVCNSFAANDFHPPAFPLRAQRGQVSYVKATATSKQWQQAWCHRGYLTPSIKGLHCMGATFDRGHSHPESSPKDDIRNQEELQAHLPEHWQALGGNAMEVAHSRVEFRCQLPDYLPLVGRVSQHLSISVGHGSRGITHTPLSAEIIAAQLTGEPLPTGMYVLNALDPLRFS